LIIETEWARRNVPAANPKDKPLDGSDYMRIQRLVGLATALAAVDPDRALGMLKTLPGSSDSDCQRQAALTRILKYVMSHEATQRTMRMDGYGDVED
jgi:hypothetical protein